MNDKILAILQKLNDRLSSLEANILTRTDLKGFATKDDLKNFTTKDDLKGFATKDDLIVMEGRLNRNFASKDDLLAMTKRFEKTFATKSDINALKKELIEYTDQWFGDLMNSLDKNKAEVSDVENLRTRIRAVEKKLSLLQ